LGQEKKEPSPNPINGSSAFRGGLRPDYRFVNTVEALEAFVRQAGDAGMVAVDLEADSMFHYQEKVCLVQIAANGHTVVIDPLAVPDLSLLKPIFEDQCILKVFHGADYDIRSLYRDFGISINNLFDTQLACMYLGHPATSLESVVADRFGVELNKKYQKKDWSQRPLPEEMAAYAASDVIYLIPLAKALMAELESKGRLSWVVESCLKLSRVRPPETDHTPMFLRFRGAGKLSPRQLAVLEALLHARDGLARQKDRPLFKVLGNSVILKMAYAMPATIEALQNSHILTPKQINMYGKRLVAAVAGAMQLSDSRLPVYPRRKSPRLSPRIPSRVKALRQWRDQLAEVLDLDPALLFNKAMLRELARLKPRHSGEMQQVPNIHHWQIEAFGEQIVSLLKQMP
jgi:ribonuclease D